MKYRIFIISAIAVLVAGCSGEDSVTGSSDHVLSGQIFAAGTLASGSTEISAQSVEAQGAPVSGVEVRASGTGLAAISDHAGRFALMGLPSSVDLKFTRSDGINASAKVNVAANPVVTVELQKTQATIVPAGQAKKEIEGTIAAISATSITVNDASTHGPVTAEITSTTVIRHGNQSLTTANLKEGDRVHVRALINADGSLTALEIKLQDSDSDSDSGSSTQQWEGLIVSVSCSEITVNAAGKGERTATITSSTKIRKGNTTVPCATLKKDDRVHVKATAGSDNSYTAVEIKLQNPA